MKDDVLKKMTYGVYVVSTWDKGRPTDVLPIVSCRYRIRLQR